MKKNILILSLIFVFAIFGIFSLDSSKVNAEQSSNDVVRYVALGDSIADGTQLEGYEEYTFVENAYTTRFKSYLEQKYGTDKVEANTYAKASSNTDDFISLLNGVESDRYNKEIIEKALSAIEDADVITICIGANDILLPAVNNIQNFITSKIDQAGMEAILSDGLEKFETNFPNILSKITELNPNAKVIFNTIYNPYKCFKITDQTLITTAQYLGINIGNVNLIGETTEVYLAGGTNSQNETVEGLNQLLTRLLEETKNSNFYLVDVKAEFDNYIETNGESSYPTLVNVNSSQISISNFSDFTSYADPHPTSNGHKNISELISDVFSKNIFKVELNYNGGNVNLMNNSLFLLNNGEVISEPIGQYLPTYEDYEFDGWYTDLYYTNMWDFENTVTQDVTLYSKWLGETCTVTYITYGGTAVVSHEVTTGTKINEPLTSKAGYPFGGWYVDSALTTKWNFQADVVDQNLTLYAKWITIKCLNESYLTQDISDLNEINLALNITDNEGFSIEWYVNGSRIEGEVSSSFTYCPTKSGSYSIYAMVNSESTQRIELTVNRSILSQVEISLKSRDTENNCVLTLANNTYSDDELVWYKSTNEYDSEGEQICIGKSILNYKFTENCKVWVQYKDTNQVISNVVTVTVENEMANTLIIVIIALCAVSAIIIIITIISRRRYKNYF